MVFESTGFRLAHMFCLVKTDRLRSLWVISGAKRLVQLSVTVLIQGPKGGLGFVRCGGISGCRTVSKKSHEQGYFFTCSLLV